MTSKSNLPDTELQQYADEHVFYEIEMLFAAANLTASGSIDRRMQNTFIDSLVLHARTLEFFFYPATVKPNDVIAAHFFTDPAGWNSIRPVKSKILETILGRGNKELAHLTTKRISGSPANKTWDANIVTSEFIPVIEKFVDGASPTKLAPSTATKIGNLLVPSPHTDASTPGATAAGITRSTLIVR
jgi:hypothetical protein